VRAVAVLASDLVAALGDTGELDALLIRLVDGPAGRRPRLQGTGLAVWEAISVVHDNDGDERAAAEYVQVPLGLVQAAVAYYGAYRDEVDEWIELNARESEAARAAWLAGHQALKR
jgi:uncharacterized protein (DUF433 family)